MAADRLDPSWLESPAVQAFIEVVSRRVVEHVIDDHIQSCPHGQKMASRIALLTGVAIGSGMAGGGVVLAVVKALAATP